MNIKEQSAYVKGLLEGLELDESKKETKVFKAIAQWMDDVSTSISNIDEDVDDICEQLDILDEDLSNVEEEVYSEDCDCDCDDDCDCGCHGDENFYEVKCPKCGEEICLSEDTLLDDEMNCPNCGELLEFDMSDCCNCGCDCDDDCDCDCDDSCECGCDCKDEK